MHLSEGTVRNTLSALYRNFGVRSQVELVSTVLLG
jgi:DNA-binding NarL/FixJ family response regulator